MEPKNLYIQNTDMLNYNGKLLHLEKFKITSQNRAFRYGDAIFETINVRQNNVIFWEDHYFRLMASMRMLRMEIPMQLTLEFLEQEIVKTVNLQEYSESYRVRLSIYRKDGGLYTPKTNQIDYLIEVAPNTYKTKNIYTIDIFKDFYNYSGLLSTIKTTNRMLNTLSSIYMKENDLDNCILINERKGIVEATNANVFLVKRNIIRTPALTEGCIKGIVRKKIIEIIEKRSDFIVEQTVISPFEMQKADEIFLTNTIIGIQPITNYRKRVFKSEVADKLANSLKVEIITNPNLTTKYSV